MIFRLSKWIIKATQILLYVSMFTVVLMLVLMVMDGFLRYALAMPIKGALEVTESAMTLVVFGGLAYVQTIKGHVAVDLVVERLRFTPRRVVEISSTIVGLVFTSLLVWRTMLFAMEALKTGETLMVLRLSVFPFMVFMPLGSFMLFLTQVLTITNDLRELIHGRNTKS